MAIIVQDVLKANLVLAGVRLLGSPKEQSRFDKQAGTEVLKASASIPLDLPLLTGPQELELAQKFRLDRDRIELEVVGNQTLIGMEYPSKDTLDRLAEIAVLAIRSSSIADHNLSAVGFNLEIVYTQDSGLSAYEFLTKRVFAPNLFQAAGYQIRGGAAKLLLTRGEEIWNITLEPRFNNPEENRLFASFNLHQNTSRLPKPDTIKRTLEIVWDQAHLILSQFD